MGLFDKIKKSFQGAMAYAQMDDFLIKQIDTMFCRHWEQVSKKTPTNIGGVSLEEEAEYEFVYNTPAGKVRVEMEHEWPTLEIEMKTPMEKFEVKIKVSDFVKKEGTNMRLTRKNELENIIRDMMDMVS